MLQHAELRDLFVGLVSMSLGAIALLGALMNWPWCFELRILRLVHQRWGRQAARYTVAAGGAFLLAWGVIIAFGWTRS